MNRLIAFACSVLLAASAHAAPGVGDPAPDFTLAGSDGETYTLSDLRGSYVVLAWFPKAYTGGCTIECKALRDADAEIRDYDVRYFMASVDSIEDNTGFAEQNDASFPILANPERDVAEAYGVLRGGNYAARWTFYIDGEGIIRHVDRDVNPRSAGEQLVTTLDELSAPRAAAGR